MQQIQVASKNYIQKKLKNTCGVTQILTDTNKNTCDITQILTNIKTQKYT
jgi:hypothetical protein